MMSNLDAKLTLLDALKDETEELVNMLIRAHGGGRSHGRTMPDGR